MFSFLKSGHRTEHSPTSSSSSQPEWGRTPTRVIQKPIAIPATSSHVGSPFLRAYPPILRNHSIPPSTFLMFLDNLNRVAVASPPLQALNLGGQLAGLVPEPHAQIISIGINIGTKVGIVAISKGQTEKFLKEANRDLFGPVGLKAEVAKIDTLARAAAMPMVVNGGADVNLRAKEPGTKGRLDALRPWIQELDITPLPALDAPTDTISKLSVIASERQRKKEENSMFKRREKADRRADKRCAKAEYRLERRVDKFAHSERKLDRSERKYDRSMGRMERKYEKSGRREEKVTRHILWLIIRNVEADSGSGQGIFTD